MNTILTSYLEHRNGAREGEWKKEKEGGREEGGRRGERGREEDK